MTISEKIKILIYIFLLVIFSISINQYYGYRGILPIDSFLVFNSGYDFLNGYYPFKDYRTIKEPFIDFLQAIIFKIFGVSWFSYVFHASFFNLLITLFTFFILKNLKLKINLCFFYSFCVAILTYPTAGTPFSDHHTLILCMISLYFFILALKTNKNIYWFLIPIFLGFSFLSKQAPTAYFVIFISFFSLIYFLYEKKFKGFIYAFCGFFFIIFLFFLFLIVGDISFEDFYTQYILFPQSLGSTRLDWIFPLEFKRIFLRFKLLHLSISILFIILFINFYKNKIKVSTGDLIIIVSLILTCFSFIFHQLMTINAIFIYCLIPIFSGFSHVYSIKYFNKKFVNQFLILLTFCSTIYYFLNYVNNRTFMDLRNINLSNSIDGQLIDSNLSNIKWLTMFYPESPMKEVENIKFAVNIIKNDKEKKMIITDYQFISVFLKQYDYSVTRFWYNFHGYPAEDNKYFIYWKNFVIKNIKKNNIKVIYVLKPLHGDTKPLENIIKSCSEKIILSEFFYKIKLNNC